MQAENIRKTFERLLPLPLAQCNSIRPLINEQ
jgi:hypothetical protein